MSQRGDQHRPGSALGLAILLARGAAKAPIYLYRYTLSAFMGRTCRFLPTCSEFAIEAIDRHGAIRGLALSARRICRCHPWGGSGYDPVPGKTDPTSGRR